MVARLRLSRFNHKATKETRWRGFKSRKLGDGYKLIFYGTSNRNVISVILSETFRNSVTAVDRLSDCLMAVKVGTGEVELRVFSVYAPQVSWFKEEKACFWEDLEQYVQSLEGEEVLLIGEDFNGYVGSREDGFESRYGRYGYGARNNDGFRILEYAVARFESHLYRLSNPVKVDVQHHLLLMDLKIFRPKERRPRTRQPEDRGSYLATKREAKKAVSKAKSERCKAVQILERWREYYNQLCNEEFCYPPIPTVPSVEGLVLPITTDEVSADLAKMKLNIATGPDDIPTDV
ncbi:hypothetical protein RB195_026020 [Necator americanus]|uniref:Endonuclease/exonuclease/phosphatase domain-containing protein n=1 Tax=Necator americanus TaxID=51031 RepID=A0ABR1EUX6_NECAM